MRFPPTPGVFYALVDSGNEWRTVISPRMATQLGFETADLIAPETTLVGTAKEGAALRVLGLLPRDVNMSFVGAPKRIGVCAICPAVLEGLAMDINLSGPFLKAQGIDQIHSKNLLRYRGADIPLSHRPGKKSRKIYAAQTLELDDRGVVELEVNGAANEGESLIPSSGALEDVLVGPLGQGTALLVNETKFPRIVQRGTHLATVEESLPAVTAVDARRLEGRPPPLVEGRKATRDRVPVSPEWIKEQFAPQFALLTCALDGEGDKQKALSLLCQFADLFSANGEFGRTTLVKHAIRTGDHAPVKCRNRPVNPALLGDLRAQMEEWISQDVIEPSESPWASALVAVKKKNGKTRWCVDYRAVNAVTQKDAYPMPLIEDNLAHLAHSTVFSTVDGTGAFHVVELEEESKPKTAFSTPWGLYQFKRMPFGLTNAPATYSRLMQVALRKIPTNEALSYLDDTLIHSRDVAGHLKSLGRVLEAHREAGLKLQPSKCHLFCREVNYLGHTVSQEGVKPMEDYTRVVSTWPMPTTLTEARSFLGKVGYYRRFIQGYGKIAGPLIEATKEENLEGADGKTLKVTEEMKASHQALRRALCQAPILAYPRFNDEDLFIVDTDWSQEHRTIGAVLSQQQEGKERVIAYGAKKLSTSQANYPATKGELFAIIYFLRHWRYYLQWKRFILRTDHRALTWIRTMEAPSGMIARWLDTLANYDFEVRYRPGEKHGNADGLSRATHINEAVPEETEPEAVGSLNVLEDVSRDPHTGYALPTNPGQWSDQQRLDLDLVQVMEWIQKPDKVPQETRGLPPRLRYLLGLRGRMRLSPAGMLEISARAGGENGLPQKAVPVIPQHLERTFILRAHEFAAHRGIQATSLILSARAFLVSGRAAVARAIAGCLPCQAKRGQPSPQRHTYAHVPTGFPFQRISIDFVGPLPKTKKGHTMLLTVKDPFTKWVEAFPLRRATAEAVADKLTEHIFARFGYPDNIHSDRGTQFTSELIVKLGRKLGIATTTTPAYHPQSNPVERAHRDLKTGLRAALGVIGGTEWDECLPQILFAFRIAPARGTGVSPFVAMFGRDPNIPLGVMAPDADQAAEAGPSYVDALWKRMERVHRWVRTNLAREVCRQQRSYTQPRRSYQVGESVWLYSPQLSAQVGRKLVRPWTGPWVVSKVVSEVVYEITNDGGKTVTAALDRLQPYQEEGGGAPRGTDAGSRFAHAPDDLDGSTITLPGATDQERPPGTDDTHEATSDSDGESGPESDQDQDEDPTWETKEDNNDIGEADPLAPDVDGRGEDPLEDDPVRPETAPQAGPPPGRGAVAAPPPRGHQAGPRGGREDPPDAPGPPPVGDDLPRPRVSDGASEARDPPRRPRGRPRKGASQPLPTDRRQRISPAPGTLPASPDRTASSAGRTQPRSAAEDRASPDPRARQQGAGYATRSRTTAASHAGVAQPPRRLRQPRRGNEQAARRPDRTVEEDKEDPREVEAAAQGARTRWRRKLRGLDRLSIPTAELVRPLLEETIFEEAVEEL